MNRMLIVGVAITLLALLAGGVVWAAESGTLTQLPGRQAAQCSRGPGRWRPSNWVACSDNIVRGTVTAVEEDEVLIATEDEAERHPDHHRHHRPVGTRPAADAHRRAGRRRPGPGLWPAGDRR